MAFTFLGKKLFTLYYHPHRVTQLLLLGYLNLKQETMKVTNSGAKRGKRYEGTGIKLTYKL